MALGQKITLFLDSLSQYAHLRLRKPKLFFKKVHRLYQRKAKNLNESSKEQIEAYLKSLHASILEKDVPAARQFAKQCEEAAHRWMPKSAWEKARDFIVSMSVALCVAIAIRQMWFEFYTIPTGSMRPTLKETDYLVVSKTDHGINVPLQTSHFYFDPDLVQRGSIVVFTGENMDIADADTVYFYLFPGKKQFVKRLIGKPGDTLYFYGGQVYGIDQQGNEIERLNVEHIPYIRFGGKVETPGPARGGIFSSVLFYQMNELVAKLQLSSIGAIQGEMVSQQGREPAKQFGDLWGIKNFAMARLLTPAQAEKMHPKEGLEEAPLYLELTHHPTLQGAKLIRDEMNRLRPDLATSVSLIPLKQKHLDAISNHMTTCRFSVKNGQAYRLGWNPKQLASYLPKLNVPDGTYEIQDGKAYRVYWGGITRELPPTHPLYSKDPAQIQLLYNLGIEFLTQYNPTENSNASPSRYAYFKNGELYLLGAPIYQKDDAELSTFIQRENQKQLISTSINPYFPFTDSGAPLNKEGKIDINFIRKYGLIVPDKMYLVLGDNHAMSADSRQFGFVPEDNLKGGVSFLFWPPGSRFGKPTQPSHPFFTFPNLVIWGTASVAAIAWWASQRRKWQNPLKFE